MFSWFDKGFVSTDSNQDKPANVSQTIESNKVTVRSDQSYIIYKIHKLVQGYQPIVRVSHKVKLT